MNLDLLSNVSAINKEFKIKIEGRENMIRMIIFDLDSTLAPIGQGMGEEELKLFRQLEDIGVQIAICSGKTCDYLCGFMRQIGLKNPILIGENGAVIRFGIDLPPKRHYRVPFSEEAVNSLKKVRQILEERFPHIWFQPNKIGVTPFPASEEEFDKIEEVLEEYREELKGIKVFRHIDSFDIVPAQINKAVGISYLLEKMGMKTEEIIAVGDGVNDYSMFELAGYSVGVNVKEEERVDKNCKNTLEMLKFLLEYLQSIMP